MNPEISSLNEKVADLDRNAKILEDEAWQQMSSLNELFSWATARNLFQKAFTDMKFNPFFSEESHTDLEVNFGLPPSFNDGRSVYLLQSGSLKGNPFVIAKYIQHWIGSMSYSGTRMIYWTEYVRNSQGENVPVQRSQLLTASVVKPYPEYQFRTELLYGHEAAPELSFSRGPSNLSGLEDGKFNNWRKNKAVKKVERKSRRALQSGTGDLTVMSNREFEALFNAVNRDHEIQFRLLFTPLAQQESVNILNDKTVGYGDDFSFIKQGTINSVEPLHLNQTRIDANPKLFMKYDLEESRKFFNDFNNDYFRSLYFAFAPYLAIPLYREQRSIPKGGASPRNNSCSEWEHEAMANFIGEEYFRHPDSVTSNLNKTYSHSGDSSSKTVSVVSHGYMGIPMVDYVPVFGGDGNWHEVAVPWVDYIPVQRESQMVVGVIANHDDESNAQANGELIQTFMEEAGTSDLGSNHVVIRGALAAKFGY